MKLLDMSTDMVFEAMSVMAPAVGRLVNDSDLSNLVRVPDGEKRSTADFYRRVLDAVPVLLKTHRDDTLAILGALRGVSREEMGKVPLRGVIAQIREMTEDQELRDFFGSLQQRGRTLSSGQSSSAGDFPPAQS